MNRLLGRNPFIFTILFLLFYTYSCNTGNTKKVCVKPKEINHIHFYIDNSASMQGYFGQEAEFKTIVSDLTTKIEKNIKPLDINFIAGSILKYNGNAEKFSSDIATTKIADKDGYQLHEMLNEIAAKNDSNDISILVSDCILSFPDSSIFKNHDINKGRF